MGYKKANRRLTKEQFSKSTTIDGSRIDKAIDDIIEKHNNIEPQDQEAVWMPSTINCNWSSSRTFLRQSQNNPLRAGDLRSGLNVTQQMERDWFPFLFASNTVSEVFPSDQQPSQFGIPGIQNRFRNKGYSYNPFSDRVDETYGRYSPNRNSANEAFDVNDNATQMSNWGAAGASWGGINNIVEGNGSIVWLNKKYMTLTIPLYFKDPVILTNVSVFGGQEHPLASYNGYFDSAGFTNTSCQINADGYKEAVAQNTHDNYDTYMPNAATTYAYEYEVTEDAISNNPPANTFLAAATGMERPGELSSFTQRSLSDATIQVLLDNKDLPENAALSQVIYSQSDLGDTRWKFNRNFNTSNRGTVVNARTLGDDAGMLHQDMEPRFSGGPTWGTWVKQDNLNIPIPGDSRIRFCVTVRGTRPSFIFDWHLALTVLEQVK